MDRASSLPRTRPASSEVSVPSVERVARHAGDVMQVASPALTRREALQRVDAAHQLNTAKGRRSARRLGLPVRLVGRIASQASEGDTKKEPAIA